MLKNTKIKTNNKEFKVKSYTFYKKIQLNNKFFKV